ncbi:NUDIX hydrolase, partial [Micrococcus sp. HSID17245]|uniref:NUDIX hydrolase n=1 Tax=Micrococcus sp. HSID17245 TaxID=2419508 RepID=UPI000FB70656
MPSSHADRVARWSTEDRVSEGPRAEVLAAGMLPWRRVPGGLEVMVIHRPRYDDWSWPKGKLDPGETLPECAVRELREEVGLELRPGIPLCVTAYEVPGKRGARQSKEVWYWAAEVDGQRALPDGDEVDEVRWIGPDEARRLLTNDSDREPLDLLLRAASRGRLRTVPLLVLRHAKAKPRSSWSRAEQERPLAATG